MVAVSVDKLKDLVKRFENDVHAPATWLMDLIRKLVAEAEVAAKKAVVDAAEKMADDVKKAVE